MLNNHPNALANLIHGSSDHTRTSVQYKIFAKTVGAGLRPLNVGRRCCHRLGLPAIRKSETGLIWQRGGHPGTPATEHTLSSTFTSDRSLERLSSLRHNIQFLQFKGQVLDGFLDSHTKTKLDHRKVDARPFFRTCFLDNRTLQGGGGSKTQGSKESFEDMGNRRWFLGVLHCQTKRYNLEN